MKKTVSLLLAIALLLSLVACGSKQPQSPSPESDSNVPEPSTIPSEEISVAPEEPANSTMVPNDSSFGIDLTGITTIEELEIRIDEDIDDSIATLNASWESFSAEIDTYDKYLDNAEKVIDFYQTVITETEQMCIKLYEYSAVYARMVLDSDMSAGDRYDAIDGINDCLYDDACEKIHDDIYDGVLDDMNEYFYKGILDDAQEDVDYSDWYDVCSNEYSQWYDTSSEVYGLYYDTASEIYSLYYDMAGELYSEDYERAEKVYEKFLEKIAKMKGQGGETTSSAAAFDTTLRTANNTEELETIVETHVSECIQALWAEWKTFSTENDSLEKYKNNVDAVEEFHTHIEESTSQIFLMISNYGISYAELILQSDSSAKDMYNSFEDLKDCIYEDACEEVKEEIYEDLLGEIKDYYYDGIIDDAKDSIDYSDWSDARSDTYNWWSDTRGEVYDNWSDTRSDLYDLCSEIRSELYDGDIDAANDELQNFRESIA